MRILHTGDWHLGKTLYGFDRTPEISAALDESLEAALQHDVDAVLVAGDIFHTRNPSADAEAAVYKFFKHATGANLPIVMIAGNHDSPRRLDAMADFMKGHQIHIVGRLRHRDAGGMVSLDINGERLMVGCFPFVSDRVLRTSQEMMGEEGGEGIVTYQEKVQQFMQGLALGFRNDTANVLMMHGTMDGVTLSGSERVFHSGRDYTIDPNHIPELVSYVAMGHIHKPQALRGFTEEQARYCGSVVQLDFGEVDDQKSAYIVELKPGAPARTVAAVPLAGGRELRQEHLTLPELEARHEELRAFGGHLKLVLKLEQHDPSVRERVRQSLPNARIIQTEVPRRDFEGVVRDAASRSLQENFEQFWREGHKGELDEAVMKKFIELQERVESEEEVA